MLCPGYSSKTHPTHSHFYKPITIGENVGKSFLQSKSPTTLTFLPITIFDIMPRHYRSSRAIRATRTTKEALSYELKTETSSSSNERMGNSFC